MADEVTDCSNKEQFVISLDGLIKLLIPMRTLLEFKMLITLNRHPCYGYKRRFH